MSHPNRTPPSPNLKAKTTAAAHCCPLLSVKSNRACITVYRPLHNAHQLSFYWEGDLRILSYFLNKRKELEFKLKYCWPSIFDERESATNNRITDKLSVLRRKWGIIHSLKILRRTRKLRVLLVRIWNACLTHFRCSCQDDTFMTKNALIFSDFFRPILTWQDQRKWCCVSFYQEGHSALVQKNYQTKPWHIGTYTKSFSFLWQMCTEIWRSKVGCF